MTDLDKPPVLAYGVRERRRISRGAWLRFATVILLIGGLLAMIILPMRMIGYRSTATQCQANLRQIARVCMMYVQQNGGSFPASLDDVATYAPTVMQSIDFTCPACVSKARRPSVTVGKLFSSDYIYCPPSNYRLLGDPAHAVLAYEPLSNHNNRGICVLFCDGHCEWLAAAEAKAVIANLPSGQTRRRR